MASKNLSKYEEMSVSFCPGCKSHNVRYVFGAGNLFGIVPKMQCKDCGISAASFPILTTTQDAIEKSQKKKALKKKTVKKKKTKKTVRAKK